MRGRYIFGFAIPNFDRAWSKLARTNVQAGDGVIVEGLYDLD